MALVYVQRIYDTTLNQYVRYSTLVPTTSPVPSTTVPVSSGNYNPSTQEIIDTYDDPNQGGGGGGVDPELEARVSMLEGDQTIFITKDDFVYTTALGPSAWIYTVPDTRCAIYYDFTDLDALGDESDFVGIQLPSGADIEEGFTVYFHQSGVGKGSERMQGADTHPMILPYIPPDPGTPDLMEGAGMLLPWPQTTIQGDVVHFGLTWENNSWRMVHWSSLLAHQAGSGGGSIPMSGDVTGTSGSSTVTAIRNVPVTTPLQQYGVMVHVAGNFNQYTTQQIANRGKAIIVIGNASSAFGDTVANCDYLDSGNGSILASVASQSGTVILLRPGIYTLTSPISVGTGTIIMGAGNVMPFGANGSTIIRLTSTVRKFATLANTAQLYDLSIQQSAIAGVGASGDCVIDTIGNNSNIERVHMSIDTQSVNETITACVWHKIANSRHVMRDCTFTATGTNNLTGLPLYGVRSNTGSITDSDLTQGVRIINSAFVGMDYGIQHTRGALYLSNSYIEARMRGLDLSGPNLSTNVTYEVIGNRIFMNPIAGAVITESAVRMYAPARFSKFVDNTIWKDGAIVGGTYGIHLSPSLLGGSSATGILAARNTISGFAVGVNLDANTSKCQVSENILLNNTTPITNTGTGNVTTPNIT